MDSCIRMRAPCGLDCSTCNIYQAGFDDDIARKTIAWFKENHQVDLTPDDFRCQGCRGDLARHWSPDCWIRACCFDEKGLEFCSQCREFPCDRLVEWSRSGSTYAEALDYLRHMQAI